MRFAARGARRPAKRRRARAHHERARGASAGLLHGAGGAAVVWRRGGAASESAFALTRSASRRSRMADEWRGFIAYISVSTSGGSGLPALGGSRRADG